MRFFHIADVHLGVKPDQDFPWSRDRGREIWNSFRKVIEQAGREHADLFLIAGDLFHRQPLMRELREVNALFSSIPDTRIVLIAGNHDYAGSDSPYKKFPWAPNVFGLWNRGISYVDFPELETRVWGGSYDRREIKEPLYDRLRASGEMPVEILLAHGGDERHIPMSMERLAGAGFAYIALGHIHKPQEFFGGRIAYGGALEPVDKQDTGPHGYRKGEIRGNSFSSVFCPSSLREYRELDIELKKSTSQYTLEKAVEKAIRESGQQRMYRLVLTGEKALDMELSYEDLYELGRVVKVEDRTRPAYSEEKLCSMYPNSILEEYIKSMSGKDGEKEKKALAYGIRALLESGEGLL